MTFRVKGRQSSGYSIEVKSKFIGTWNGSTISWGAEASKRISVAAQTDPNDQTSYSVPIEIVINGAPVNTGSSFSERPTVATPLPSPAGAHPLEIGNGGSGTATVFVKVASCADANTAPVLTIPNNDSKEATGQNTPYSFVVLSSDKEDGVLAPTCKVGTTTIPMVNAPNSVTPADAKAYQGSLNLPIGSTTITCSAIDSGRRTDGTADQVLTTPASFQVVVSDTIAPTVTPGNITQNTWRNTPLAQAFMASDAGSGLAVASDASFTLTASAQSANATTPTVASKTVTDVSGNTTTRTVSALIDLAKPTISAATFAADGTTPITPNANGWFKQPVVVKFTCTDAHSGIVASGEGACPEAVTVGANSDTGDSGQTVSGAVKDNAGNTSDLESLTVKVDKTAPTISATVSPTPNAAGWNNSNTTVIFTCSDGDCPAPVVVSSETAGQTVSHTVTDRAGNTASASALVKLDKTAPTPSLASTPATPDGLNGWYKTDVSFVGANTDALSGPATCTTVSPLRTDSASHTVTTTCSDIAGNIADASMTVKRDATRPVINATADRAPNSAGWYNANVMVSYTCTDATPGSNIALGTCPAAVVVDSDTPFGGRLVSATVTDQAGNESLPDSVNVKLDKTAPTVTPGNVSDSLWRNEPLAQVFAASDTLSGLAMTADSSFTLSVSTQSTSTTTPTVASKTVTDVSGNTTTRTVSALIDLTKPTISAATFAADGTTPITPNVNGWFNQTVVVKFTCADDLSGLSTNACPEPITVSADTTGKAISETVKDNAGNISVPAVLTIKLDKTAPVISAAADRAPNSNGWYSDNVTVTFTCSDAMSGVTDSCPASKLISAEGTTPVSDTVTDQAGNTATSNIVTVKLDKTSPVISGSDMVNSTWRNNDLSETFTVTDALSGLANTSDTPFTLTASAESTISTPTVVTRTVTDLAGNSTTRTLSARIDKTVPTTASITPNPAAPNGLSGWYKSAVSFETSGTDALSGGVTCTAIPDLVNDNAGTTVNTTCKDLAGNTKEATLAVKMDKTFPVLTTSGNLTVNATGNSQALVSFIAPTATDNFTSPITATCDKDSPLNVSVGTTTVNCSSTDAAGNKTTKSFTITVNYNFTGFFQPIDMSTSTNIVYNTIKVGSAVPVKFKLGGNQGPNIFLAGSPSALMVNCATNATTDVVEEISAATVSGLQYDAAAGQYVYVWKTSTAYKVGSCYQLTVKFLDNTTQTAYFQFK
ncbi:PxKF domain-containing protein [Deinococcus sp. QL22]|uniref:PxKF domain-containing protein n=1 Tax=Deinococcus sp. QL22 TaxID=2939437 RepID=UPI0020174A3B|nr:PxKF domain-containing protein [Deinococcus sp. QL22]UQN08819.1 PxKF domain-containing protein [Deinococcus sp. QL22]